MCGIIGYVGSKNVIPVLMEGLRRLSYRGYDSSGIAYFSEGAIQVKRAVGKLEQLEKLVLAGSVQSGGTPGSDGEAGIGHTRWATHGKPSETNAHPHRIGSIVLIHNGIIENYLSLKQQLQATGHLFVSETDTEVCAHLIDQAYQREGSLERAVQSVVSLIHGSHAFCVISEKEPGRVIAVRAGCPLVIGIAEGETYVASDIPAFLAYTRKVLFMEDGEIAVLTREGVTLSDLTGQERKPVYQHILWDMAVAEKGGHRHFLEKEIHEQPSAIINTLAGRLEHASGKVFMEEIRLTGIEKCRRIVLVACGTSWHAALVGKFLIEAMADLPVEVDIASEFRYRNPRISSDDWVVAISQSGETADTLSAIKEASKITQTLSICNAMGSSISRATHSVLYTHAGPEISVASTKAFTTQIMTLVLFAIYLGKKRNYLSHAVCTELMEGMFALPRQMEEILKHEGQIVAIAKKYFRSRDFLCLGRGILYPVALEGALKIKEITYIHAEGYPAGEMKHGPIALIDENMPVIALVPKDGLREKIIGNMMEVHARGGKIIAFTEDTDLSHVAEDIFQIPEVHPYLSPILMALPFQMLAYHMAVLLGTDVDQPRNLAKSVTVE